MKQRIIELEQEIKKHQDLYYNGESIITDVEFDNLVDELSKLDPDNKLLHTEIGQDYNDDFKKEKHLILMGSQSKANTEEEMNKWLKTINGNIIVTHKLDGISIELNYIKGKFISAITRGDGIYGDLVTNNIKKTNIPLKINEDFTGAIRGEVLLSRNNKNKYYPEMKNCRNAAAGIIKRLDGNGCEHLSVICYEAQYLDKNKSFETQLNLLYFLEKNKFNVVKYEKLLNNNGKNCIDTLNNIFNKFDELEYDIDGLVFKQNKIDEYDLQNNIRPKTQIALKPAKVLKETEIINIKWNVKNGTITPIIQFKPVDIQGSTIKQASGYNIAFLEDMKIEIGDKILVTKFNMIIPGIIKNITKNTYNKT